MPRSLKLMSTVCLFSMLAACATKPIKLIAEQTSYQGLVTQSVVFTIKQESYQWVCYSEVVQQQVTGISCQNDTALPLFSGGLNEGEFEFDYPSRWLLKIQPIHMLAYIKMSLFDELQLDSKRIAITKQHQQTTIKDYQRKIDLSIKTL